MTTPKKYRKKPIVVDATQWFKNGDHPEDKCLRPYADTGEIPTEPREGSVVRRFRHPDIHGHYICRECGIAMHSHGWVDTREGGHIVCPGDWIITGVVGEHYPCKPDIFDLTYEGVT